MTLHDFLLVGVGFAMAQVARAFSRFNTGDDRDDNRNFIAMVVWLVVLFAGFFAWRGGNV